MCRLSMNRPHGKMRPIINISAASNSLCKLWTTCNAPPTPQHAQTSTQIQACQKLINSCCALEQSLHGLDHARGTPLVRIGIKAESGLSVSDQPLCLATALACLDYAPTTSMHSQACIAAHTYSCPSKALSIARCCLSGLRLRFCMDTLCTCLACAGRSTISPA